MIKDCEKSKENNILYNDILKVFNYKYKIN